ncbi:hypothetical protein EMIHUDRAFT_121037, partial [Emiliania huxleyi CCMP1516]|uniref:Alkyl transferase n=2 Tax=Emiliania huxleyi TaxID=2903 RepID=A0A0D3I985_EMIH1
MPQAASSDAGLAWWQRAACSVVSAGPLPRHVAFIMDGNRRWARNRGLPVAEGHRRGYAKLEESLRWCAELGVAAVTCYAFSLENFKRSAEEVDTLMALMGEKLRSMRREDSLIMTQRVRVRVVGNLARVPADVRAEIDAVTRLTSAHERAVLTVCFAYTSREEVASAVSSLAEAAAARTLCPSELTARSAQSQTLQSQPDAVYWTFVAIVALTPLLLFLIAVTAKCMLRRERQDMGVGDAEIVSILCKAHTADVRVRLAITYFTLCCAWAIYTVTDLSAYIKWLLDMSSTRSQAVFDEQWSLPAPLLGVIDGIIPRLILLALRPVDREGMCAVGAYSVVQGLICLASDYNMFKHRYIPEAEAAEWSPRATAIVCFMAGTFPRWSFFTLANLSAALYLLAGDAVPFFLQQCCWGSLIGTCVVVPVYLYRGRIQRGAMSMVLPSDANGLVAVAALMRSGLSPRAFEQRTLEA